MDNNNLNNPVGSDDNKTPIIFNRDNFSISITTEVESLINDFTARIYQDMEKSNLSAPEKFIVLDLIQKVIEHQVNSADMLKNSLFIRNNKGPSVEGKNEIL